MYVCMYVCMYDHAHIYIYIYTYAYTYSCTYLYVSYTYTQCNCISANISMDETCFWWQAHLSSSLGLWALDKACKRVVAFSVLLNDWWRILWYTIDKHGANGVEKKLGPIRLIIGVLGSQLGSIYLESAHLFWYSSRRLFQHIWLSYLIIERGGLVISCWRETWGCSPLKKEWTLQDEAW